MAMDIKRELLALLAEEGSEVAQAAIKAFRFGPDTRYENGPTKIQELVAEINDVLAIKELLEAAGVEFVGLGDRLAIKNKQEKTMRLLGWTPDDGPKQLQLGL